MKTFFIEAILSVFSRIALIFLASDVEAGVGIEVMAARTSSSDNVYVCPVGTEPSRSKVSRMYHMVMFAWLVVL